MFAQPSVAKGVMLLLFPAVMRRPVEFDDQAMRDAKKIGDVAANRSLPPELVAFGGRAAQRGPKNGFGLGHVSPQAASKGRVTIRNAVRRGAISAAAPSFARQ